MKFPQMNWQYDGPFPEPPAGRQATPRDRVETPPMSTLDCQFVAVVLPTWGVKVSGTLIW